jgi:hypothetical protein
MGIRFFSQGVWRPGVCCVCVPDIVLSPATLTIPRGRICERPKVFTTEARANRETFESCERETGIFHHGKQGDTRNFYRRRSTS